MRFQILGSGGAVPVPLPFCKCALCANARKDHSLRRNSSCLYVPEIRTLVDCPEDISDSLNRHCVSGVDNLFITHWHPDHCFGLRILLESYYDFIESRPLKQIDVFIPKASYEKLRSIYPVDFFINIQKMGNLTLIDDGDSFEFGDMKVSVVGYGGKGSTHCAFLFEQAGKRALYAPCDTIDFEGSVEDLDLLVHECGLLSKVDTEISFSDMIERFKDWKPKRVVLTHFEEPELRLFSDSYDAWKEECSNLKFAEDGMLIEV